MNRVSDDERTLFPTLEAILAVASRRLRSGRCGDVWRLVGHRIIDGYLGRDKRSANYPHHLLIGASLEKLAKSRSKFSFRWPSRDLDDIRLCRTDEMANFCRLHPADLHRRGKLNPQHSSLLLYPQQNRSSNANLYFKCFRPSAVARDRGELMSVRQMIDAAISITACTVRVFTSLVFRQAGPCPWLSLP